TLLGALAFAGFHDVELAAPASVRFVFDSVAFCCALRCCQRWKTVQVGALVVLSSAHLRPNPPHSNSHLTATTWLRESYLASNQAFAKRTLPGAKSPALSMRTNLWPGGRGPTAPRNCLKLTNRNLMPRAP